MTYNIIAPYYNFLSSLFFINRQHLAHFIILDYVEKNDKILWIGGGTGKFIPELNKLNKNISIDYIDISSKMIGLAKKQDQSNLNINYIISDILNYDLIKKYDVVMTTFLFDNFTQNTADKLYHKISKSLKNEGIWLYVDFVENQSVWQKTITKLMIIFFKLVVGLQISNLPKMNSLFKNHYQIVSRKLYFKGYIESVVYKKIIKSTKIVLLFK